MYRSRYRFSNDYISVAVDTKNGSLLELVDLRTGDNLVKNHRHSLPGTFELLCASGKRFSVPAAESIYKNPRLAARLETIDNGVRVSYEALTDGKDTYDIALSYTIILEECKAKWSIDFTNNTSQTVIRCKFPYVCGIWLGNSYEDDTLVYPYNAGIKIDNPTDYLTMPRKQIGWRWQDYKYTYNIEGMGLYPDCDGLYSLSSKYSGPLSMSWCDLYDSTGGIYFASHSTGEGIISVRVEAMGAKSAGVNLAIANEINTLKGEKFCYDKGVIVLHEGDWHEGADIYRSFRGNTASYAPDWYKSNPGLFAHYDFKYQNGGVVHKFTDILELAKQAADVGLKHLLIAGWHRDGFDCGFPMYEVDSELGSVDELEAGVKFAHSLGIKVSFYINSRIANTKYTELSALIKQGAVVKSIDADGSNELAVESYGNLDLEFAVMCAGSKVWQDKIASAFDYVKAVGADGIYFDQIAMAPPCVCYNSEHGHMPDSWNKGCQKLLSLANERSLSLIIEGCSDLYGNMVAGQLVSTFSYIACAFPELYKYTFPKQILVDMVYPKRGLAMRPTFIGDNWKRLIDTAFLCSSYLWAYDLVEDNTFTNDSEAYKYLKNVVEARRRWSSELEHLTFRDDIGILVRGDVKAKCYGDTEQISFACDSSGEVLVEKKVEIDKIILAVGNEKSIVFENDILRFDAPATGVVSLRYKQ